MVLVNESTPVTASPKATGVVVVAISKGIAKSEALVRTLPIRLMEALVV
jgi:hypothetical protein